MDGRWLQPGTPSSWRCCTLARSAAAPENKTISTALRLLIASTAAILGLQVRPAVQPARTVRSVAPGITLIQESRSTPRPLLVNIIKADLKVPGVAVRCGQARGGIAISGPLSGRERLDSIVAREGAVAGVNADYFPFTGASTSLAIRDSELLREPIGYRACLGIGHAGVRFDVLKAAGALAMKDGSQAPLDGINRLPHGDECILLTPQFRSTPTVDRAGIVVVLRDIDAPIRVSQSVHGRVESVSPLDPGTALPSVPPDGALVVALGRSAEAIRPIVTQRDVLAVRFDLVAAYTDARGELAARGGARRGGMWSDVEQAVGGGPMLVRDGQIAIDATPERLDGRAFADGCHARTAVGVTLDGALLIVTVDGRAPWSGGVSLPELAALMRDLGAQDAMNLDGGGSTTMVVDGVVVNAPSDGAERPIADALLVYGEAPVASDAGLTIEGASGQNLSAAAGDTLALRLSGNDRGPTPSGPAPVWGTTDGTAFVSQTGSFVGRRAGTRSVTAVVGTARLRASVAVIAGPPARLDGKLAPAENNPRDRSVVIVHVRDRFGNPVNGVPIRAEVAGGQMEGLLITGADGSAAAEVAWSAPGRGSLTLHAGASPSLTLEVGAPAPPAGKADAEP